MDHADLERVADLLHQRNLLDAQLAELIGRPMTSGHLGEWLAAEIFDIDLERSAVTPGFDGRFRSGPLHGRTVNIKWYLKRDNLLDIASADTLDFYLVLTGPTEPAESSRHRTRPWVITAAYLFDARDIRNHLLARGVKVGTASSVPAAWWQDAEVYPRPASPLLTLTPDQARLLQLFTTA